MRAYRQIAFGLALFLLCDQAVVLRHGIDHLVAPADQICALCLYGHDHQQALVHTGYPCHCTSGSDDPGAHPPATDRAVYFLPYESRAPPQLA